MRYGGIIYSFFVKSNIATAWLSLIIWMYAGIYRQMGFYSWYIEQKKYSIIPDIWHMTPWNCSFASFALELFLKLSSRHPVCFPLLSDSRSAIVYFKNLFLNLCCPWCDLTGLSHCHLTAGKSLVRVSGQGLSVWSQPVLPEPKKHLNK